MFTSLHICIIITSLCTVKRWQSWQSPPCVEGWPNSLVSEAVLSKLLCVRKSSGHCCGHSVYSSKVLSHFSVCFSQTSFQLFPNMNLLLSLGQSPDSLWWAMFLFSFCPHSYWLFNQGGTLLSSLPPFSVCPAQIQTCPRNSPLLWPFWTCSDTSSQHHCI